jgi:hypothetical protein
MFTYGVILGFVSSLVVWGAVCAFVGWLLAKITKRPVAVFVRRGLIVAAVIAALGSLGALMSRLSTLGVVSESGMSVASEDYDPADWPSELQVEQARRAHRALQEEVVAAYMLMHAWNMEDITATEYRGRAPLALEACREAVERQRECTGPFASFGDNDVIGFMMENYTLKASQVHCLEQIHRGIIEIEDGEAETGLARLTEYDTRFNELQARYEANGAYLLELVGER